MHVAKTGLRVLGIAESFSSGDKSILAGLVMRKDLRIDGISFETTTVGGMDATDAVISLYRRFKRQDINAIMISGCVISWFNIINPVLVWKTVERPVIIVTYEESEGIEEDIKRHFPGDDERLCRYRDLGTRIPVILSTGHTIYIRPCGICGEDAAALCSSFTLDGKIPEPLRVARLCARAVLQYGKRNG
ncbi:MAG TPA: DUF99 family protein [Methanoregulaceae archaeon]|nr:MAG: DUF99 family protein [Methanolinea sp.]HON82300.1 DUF99 family protein [Methanoregulaceae archaeon]HPD11050.1 DUF99 family protein [Methanoregulaceae archaeon]HRT16133.1 DUF99 family protein [Methanoregulaceae archaeon]HRU31660.1 DUF99 family protein [Methanoregulaceae archaeon]